jgi:hypothetical protein
MTKSVAHQGRCRSRETVSQSQSLNSSAFAQTGFLRPARGAREKFFFGRCETQDGGRKVPCGGEKRKGRLVPVRLVAGGKLRPGDRRRRRRRYREAASGKPFAASWQAGKSNGSGGLRQNAAPGAQARRMLRGARKIPSPPRGPLSQGGGGSGIVYPDSSARGRISLNRGPARAGAAKLRCGRFPAMIARSAPARPQAGGAASAAPFSGARKSAGVWRRVFLPYSLRAPPSVGRCVRPSFRRALRPRRPRRALRPSRPSRALRPSRPSRALRPRRPRRALRPRRPSRALRPRRPPERVRHGL